MWQPGWEQSLGESGYMYMYGWVPSLFTWNYHNIVNWLFAVVQSLSHVRLFAIPWTAAHQASLSFTISWSLLKFMSIESVMPSNHHILCHPLLLLPSIFSSIRVFSIKSALRIRWPKYWSFSFSISCSIGMNTEPVHLGLAPLWAFVSISQDKIKEGRK